MYKPSPAINTNTKRAAKAVWIPGKENKTKNAKVLNNIRIVSTMVETYNHGSKNLWHSWGFYYKLVIFSICIHYIIHKTWLTLFMPSISIPDVSKLTKKSVITNDPIMLTAAKYKPRLFTFVHIYRYTHTCTYQYRDPRCGSKSEQ